MTTPCFFGYGSLVNRATHSYPNAVKARAIGWQRLWVQTEARPFSFLSVKRSEGEILGLIADVPKSDWAALDAREAAYDRLEDTANIKHARKDNPAVSIYAVNSHEVIEPDAKAPILLSYLDVVLQGFDREYGAKGVSHFLETTMGWDAPVLDDRAQPIYPRHQKLSSGETDLVDRVLFKLGSKILHP